MWVYSSIVLLISCLQLGDLIEIILKEICRIVFFPNYISLPSVSCIQPMTYYRHIINSIDLKQSKSARLPRETLHSAQGITMYPFKNKNKNCKIETTDWTTISQVLVLFCWAWSPGPPA